MALGMFPPMMQPQGQPMQPQAQGLMLPQGMGQGLMTPPPKPSAPELHVVRSPQETTADLLQRFEYADSWRQQYDAKAIEWYKLYVGHRENSPIEGRSNLHIPRTYEICDTLRARFVKSFFSARPYFEFLPAPPRNGQADLKMLNEKKGDLAAGLVDQQLVRNHITSKFYNYITSLLIFPLAIIGVGWRFEQRPVKRKEPVVVGWAYNEMGYLQPQIEYQVVEHEETVWDDNEITNIDYFDFWADPRRPDLDSARFVFHRDWMTQEETENYLDLLREAGDGDVHPVNWDEIKNVGDGLEEGRWERLSAVGMSPETGPGHWADDDEGASVSKNGNLFELLHYWENGRHAILINRHTLAYDGANPYWRHGKKPFIVSSFEPLPGEIYGMSCVQIIEHLQAEANTQRNQRLDNVNLVLNRMWKVRRGADISPQELVSRPHGIIHVDNADDVTELAMNDVTASSYQDEMLTKADMENALGAPAIVRGATPDRKETATEVVTKNSNASIRFDVKIMLFEATGINRLVELMDCNNQQFIDTARPVNQYGQESTSEWATVEPGQLIGEWDYTPSSANVDPAANKELRRQQLSEVLAFSVQTNSPFLKKYEIYKAWLQSFDFRNADQFLYTQEEVIQMQQAYLAQQQMMAGGGGGMQGAPQGMPPNMGGGAPPMMGP